MIKWWQCVHHVLFFCCRPLMYAVSALLPIAYIVGLIFTLKTHAYIYEDDEEGATIWHSRTHTLHIPILFTWWCWQWMMLGEGEGEDAPEWGRLACLAILICGTVAFSFVTDTLLDSLEPSLTTLGLKQSFVSDRERRRGREERQEEMERGGSWVLVAHCLVC